MPHPWNINGKQFPSSAAVVRYVEAMLDRYLPEQPLDKDDEAFVADLLKRHPHYLEKIGAGISYIVVYAIPNTPDRRFDIIRVDGTRIDVSYRKCLVVDRKPMTAITSILRHLVRPQVEAFLAHRYLSGEGWRCEQCQDLILMSGQAHAHHLDPWSFQRLVADWIELYRIEPALVAIVGDHRYQGHSRFTDPHLANTWIDYHQLNAQLRLLCKVCHAEITAQQKRSKPNSQGAKA